MSNHELEERVLSVLAWESALPALNNLKLAIEGGSKNSNLNPKTAICFDSNVFLKVANGKRSTEIIDYLDNKHEGPIILPIQVIQEFWNNQGQAIEIEGQKIEQKFKELFEATQKIDAEYAAFKDGASKLVEEFKNDFGHVFISQSRPGLGNLLDMLLTKAITSQVRRERFANLVVIRDATKTPPGFKDPGDGDFFVWAEFLLGLLLAKKSGQVYDEALLVTDDVKKDWSTKGIPHPILSAELFVVAGVPFRVMTLEEFTLAIKSALK